jgi:hypothetical protein
MISLLLLPLLSATRTKTLLRLILRSQTLAKHLKKYMNSVFISELKTMPSETHVTLHTPINSHVNQTSSIYLGSPTPSGSGPHHYRGFMITLRHSTLGKTPLDEWSARRRNLYLSTQNSPKREIIIPPMRFKPAIPSKRATADPRLRLAAIRIGSRSTVPFKNKTLSVYMAVNLSGSLRKKAI